MYDVSKISMSFVEQQIADVHYQLQFCHRAAAGYLASCDDSRFAELKVRLRSLETLRFRVFQYHEKRNRKR